MHFRLFALISAVSFSLLLSGCVTVKARIADRERVDQELPAGAEQFYPNRAKTRQVIVVEVVEKNKQDVETVTTSKETRGIGKSTEGQSQVVAGSQETVVVHDSNFTFPNKTPEALTQSPSAAQVAVEQYAVQKDDTLQKISKKLYGSYSKWTVIYDANRDVIKDPNFLKPGTMLTIPLVDEKK